MILSTKIISVIITIRSNYERIDNILMTVHLILISIVIVIVTIYYNFYSSLCSKLFQLQPIPTTG